MDRGKLARFCEKWHIHSLGWITADEANPALPLLVDYAPEAHWSLVQQLDLVDELAVLAGKSVDIRTLQDVQRGGNAFFVQELLDSVEQLYP